MKSIVSDNFIFLDTPKEIWEAVRDSYSMNQNVSPVFEVYEDLFSLRQGDKSLEDYYRHFKGMIDELNQYHQSLITLKFLKSSVKNYIFVSFFRGSVLNSNYFDDSY